MFRAKQILECRWPSVSPSPPFLSGAEHAISSRNTTPAQTPIPPKNTFSALPPNNPPPQTPSPKRGVFEHCGNQTPSPEPRNVPILHQVLEYGDGSSDIVKALVTSVDTSRQTWVGQSTLLHQYSAPNNNSNPWSAVFSGCCRSDNLDFFAAGSNFNVVTNVRAAPVVAEHKHPNT